MHDRYSITIIPNGSGSVHKYLVKRRHLRYAIAGTGVLVLFFSFLLVHFFISSNEQLAMNRMHKELDVLKSVNAKYQVNAEKLENRLNYFSDKARKLATYVGADLSLNDNSMGIGGADYLNNRFASYMNKDLNGMDRKAEKLFKGFQELEKIFKNKNDILRHTPSMWPVKGFITDRFGYRKDPFTGLRAFHTGIDIAAKRGTPIFAPADGIVTMIGKNKGYGNMIAISHLNNVTTRYGHLLEMLVKKGQKVKRGDLIATVGNTGRSTGPHLHFEVVVKKKPVNPSDYMISEIMHF
ncbi:MAG: M23 family metallopeptidase [Acidobacteria bacterium]|nr:M23 family metallopeptidase [Acidobacteriota bacterium]